MGGFSQNIQNLKGPTRVIKILGNRIAKSVVIFLDLCVTIPLKHGSASGITKRLETIIFLLLKKRNFEISKCKEYWTTLQDFSKKLEG